MEDLLQTFYRNGGSDVSQQQQQWAVTPPRRSRRSTTGHAKQYGSHGSYGSYGSRTPSLTQKEIERKVDVSIANMNLHSFFIILLALLNVVSYITTRKMRAEAANDEAYRTAQEKPFAELLARVVLVEQVDPGDDPPDDAEVNMRNVYVTVLNHKLHEFLSLALAFYFACMVGLFIIQRQKNPELYLFFSKLNSALIVMLALLLFVIFGIHFRTVGWDVIKGKEAMKSAVEIIGIVVMIVTSVTNFTTSP